VSLFYFFIIIANTKKAGHLERWGVCAHPLHPPPRTAPATATNSVKTKSTTHLDKATHLNKSDAFPPTFAQYAGLKKAGLGDRKITLNLDYGPLEVDQKLKEAFPKHEDSGGYCLLITPERGCRNLTLIEGPCSAEILKGSI